MRLGISMCFVVSASLYQYVCLEVSKCISVLKYIWACPSSLFDLTGEGGVCVKTYW